MIFPENAVLLVHVPHYPPSHLAVQIGTHLCAIFFVANETAAGSARKSVAFLLCWCKGRVILCEPITLIVIEPVSIKSKPIFYKYVVTSPASQNKRTHFINLVKTQKELSIIRWNARWCYHDNYMRNHQISASPHPILFLPFLSSIQQPLRQRYRQSSPLRLPPLLSR